MSPRCQTPTLLGTAQAPLPHQPNHRHAVPGDAAQPSHGDAPRARRAAMGDPAETPPSSITSEGCRWAPLPLPEPKAPSTSRRIYRAVLVTHRLGNCRMAVVKNPICQRIRILLALPAEK